MAAKDPEAYLRQIRDSYVELLICEELRQKGNLPPSVVLAAVCRNLEIIGEAAGKIHPDFRMAHPEIPWRSMISARNILIQNYDGVESDIVWGIVERDIRPLLARVRNLLGEQPA
jgi:uncharacterized protein with HEPN domain